MLIFAVLSLIYADTNVIITAVSANLHKMMFSLTYSHQQSLMLPAVITELQTVKDEHLVNHNSHFCPH